MKNTVAIVVGGLALLFLQMAFRHLRTHDVARPVERVIIDIIFATILGYCSYTLFQSAKIHARQLTQKQENVVHEPMPPPI
ncbi:MAG: hypothetical protein ACRYFS_07510 [Janthinobacterium lividum]